MTFIFRNRTIFWDVLKWNSGQKKWDGRSIYIYIYIYQSKQERDTIPLRPSPAYVQEYRNSKDKRSKNLVRWCSFFMQQGKFGHGTWLML